MDRHRIFIDLPVEDFGKLARLARLCDRRPEQQAAFFIKQRLARITAPADSRDQADPAPGATPTGGAHERP